MMMIVTGATMTVTMMSGEAQAAEAIHQWMLMNETEAPGTEAIHRGMTGAVSMEIAAEGHPGGVKMTITATEIQGLKDVIFHPVTVMIRTSILEGEVTLHVADGTAIMMTMTIVIQVVQAGCMMKEVNT